MVELEVGRVLSPWATAWRQDCQGEPPSGFIGTEVNCSTSY